MEARGSPPAGRRARPVWLWIGGGLLALLVGCVACLLVGGTVVWWLSRSPSIDLPSTGPEPGVPPLPGGDGAGKGRDAPGARDTLVLPGSEPSSLDPALTRDVATAAYIYEIYGGLVTLSSDLSVVPDLAESWTIDPAGTTYTFTLHAGATFHDGAPVVAADVVYAIERACDPETASPVAETYLGDVVGCVDKLVGAAPGVAGVSAPDDRTVVIDIDAPKAYFLSKLTYPTSFVVDRRQVEGDPGWAARPNGTGPFRVAAWTPGEELVLDRHPGYHRDVAKLARVVYDLRPVSALTRYENGEIDATPVGLGDLERVSDPLNPLSAELVEGPGDLGLSYIGFNTRVPPFDDVHVRRAFNYALDKRRLTEIVLLGGAEPVDTILPPGMPGFRAENRRFTFDPERARAELAASRYGGADALPPLTLHTSGDGGGDPVSSAVSDLMGEVLGVDIAVEQAPWELFQAELDAGRYAMYTLGWSADYADPQDFLDVLFHSASPLNNMGYRNPEVDALLEAARVETDPEARFDLYARAERQILDDGPWVPLYTGVDTWLVAPYVQGFTLPPIVLPRMAAVSIARD